VLLGGRLLEIIAKTRTTSAVKEISAKRPEFARLLEEPEGSETELRNWDMAWTHK
ncbi:copA, partial [Symbiodinium pilosum]